jgi:hypothetical protein
MEKKNWSNEEDKQMLDLIAEGIPIKEMAETLKRPVGSIRSRLRTIAWHMHLAGKKKNEIDEVTGLGVGVIGSVLARKGTMKRSVGRKLKVV